MNLFRLVSELVLGVNRFALSGTSHTTVYVRNEDMLTPRVQQLVTDRVRTAQPPPKCVVIQLVSTEASFPNRARLLVVEAIRELLNEDPNLAATFVLLFPTLPDENDLEMQGLFPIVAADRVVVVGDDGRTLPEHRGDADFRTAYQARLAETRIRPAEGLQRKLVRRLGHFRRLDERGVHRGCLRTFYDGRYVADELTALITEFASRLGPFSAICAEDAISPWMFGPLDTVASRLGLQYRSVRETVSTLGRGQTLGQTLLAASMVDSGASIEVAIRRISPIVAPGDLVLLSALSTRGDRKKSRRDVNVDGVRYSIHVLEFVSQPRSEPEHCHMCNVGLPFTSGSEPDMYDMLTSFDMWSMTLESKPKLKSEDYIPRHRKSVGLLPNFNAMFKRHGAWLATKFRQRLEHSPTGCPLTPVIVCPLESPKENSVAFQFTAYLTYVFGWTVIGVPRSAISGALRRDSGEQVDRWRRERWGVQLDRAEAKEGVILVDEFKRSGSTLEGLHRIVTALGHDVLCYFPIVDFDPAGSQKISTPVYSLYDWQKPLDSE